MKCMTSGTTAPHEKKMSPALCMSILLGLPTKGVMGAEEYLRLGKEEEERISMLREMAPNLTDMLRTTRGILKEVVVRRQEEEKCRTKRSKP